VPELPEREPSVLLLGLNPSLQKTVWLWELSKGEVNRASKVAFSVGGKGQASAPLHLTCLVPVQFFSSPPLSPTCRECGYTDSCPH